MLSSTYEDRDLRFGRLVLIAQNENFQAFVKVLKDLEKKRALPFELEVCYFATTKDDVLFAAELEYWAKYRRDWKVEVFVEQGEAAPFQRGDLGQPTLKTRADRTAVFASVYSAQRPVLAERLQTLGFDNSNIHWFN